jgi:hypothetical protein
MIENLLVQGGALGIVAFIVYHQQVHMKKVIENNTLVLGKFIQTAEDCKKPKSQ